MKFIPINRHILVTPATVEEQETKLLLPEEYCSTVRPYVKCTVIRAAEDCTKPIVAGQNIIINNTMLEEVKIDGSTFYLILENHVLGIADV
tara:strand:+ start:5 stop:277 length:273 start_codon:yes stop_codon:yes gene_type:complete